MQRPIATMCGSDTALLLHVLLSFLLVPCPAANKCFADRDELSSAIDQYIAGRCANLFQNCEAVQT